MTATRRWMQHVDAFRAPPKDLAEGSLIGAAMTILAGFICSILFICEVSAFLHAKSGTDVVIDSNQDALMRINFDVTMLDMACEHVAVGVWDAFGTERQNITQHVLKQRIDHVGAEKGRPYTEEELTELEWANKVFTDQQMKELDADWNTSSSPFKHDDFQSVVDSHDFIFVNFFADWCPHCRMFAPMWNAFQANINGESTTFKDADGNYAHVRAYKVNCVDFEETCQKEKIAGFPTIRLYWRGSRDGQFVTFRGPRQWKPLRAFAVQEVAKKHLHQNAHYHGFFPEACRVKGYVEVSRVPGTLHLQALPLAHDKSLNLAYTNVSHTIHSFSFGHDAQRSHVMLPGDHQRHARPLDGRSFTVDGFHQAPQHFIKVVHTRFEELGVRSYQQTHQWSVRSIPRKTTPQAKFSYDLSPVEVVVRKAERRWYDFITSIFAIVGGAYTVMSMSSGMLNTGNTWLKASIHKLG